MDLTRNILAVRVRNAERQLLNAVDHYEKAAAKIVLERVLNELEQYRQEGPRDGD
jgi:hypothetical protein